MHHAVAFVTGSSSGFGLQACVALAREGFRVVASMRDPERRGPLEEAARQAGVAERIDIISLDVTDSHSIASAVAFAIERHGRIDVLVNNAGIAVGGFVEEIPEADWQKQFATNFFGLVAVTRAVLPHMRQRRRGTIINVSSISGRFAFPGLAPYAASKHAVEGFSEALRLEMLPCNVYVALIEPGSYKTEIWEKSRPQAPVNPRSPYAAPMTALNRIVSRIAETAPPPDEVVKLIVQVAKDPSPRLRYPVGRSVAVAILAKNLLPWRWLEKMILRRLRLRDGG
ncbi:SDR family oxidoreductase [Brevibacillus sp. SYP-B805]|uniref:SDR family oxidoreductase n=1 Tax=Brevibacillus sp. SYP-B805 TaxID=1578199 RepID=UPI003216ABA2